MVDTARMVYKARLTPWLELFFHRQSHKHIKYQHFVKYQHYETNGSFGLQKTRVYRSKVAVRSCITIQCTVVSSNLANLKFLLIQLSPLAVHLLFQNCLPLFEQFSSLCKDDFKVVVTIQFWWMISTNLKDKAYTAVFKHTGLCIYMYCWLQFVIEKPAILENLTN